MFGFKLENRKFLFYLIDRLESNYLGLFEAIRSAG